MAPLFSSMVPLLAALIIESVSAAFSAATEYSAPSITTSLSVKDADAFGEGGLDEAFFAEDADSLIGTLEADEESAAFAVSAVTGIYLDQTHPSIQSYSRQVYTDGLFFRQGPSFLFL